MRLEYLADHVSHLPQLAKWHHAEFGYLSPANTVERYVERLNASLRKSELPTMFVSLRDDMLLGSASLVRQTITHQHLSPWLSSVYVDPAHRGGADDRGVHHQAVEAAVADLGLGEGGDGLGERGLEEVVHVRVRPASCWRRS